jgi:hypothetical protein
MRRQMRFEVGPETAAERHPRIPDFRTQVVVQQVINS